MLGSIWWVCLRYMWILCPKAPSHGICGMSIIADLCIPCHILIVLWIIMAVVLWTRVVYISYGTVSWCPLHFCHTCSFSSIQPLLVLLDRLSGFAIFTCGFIIIWHRPMVYVASPSSLSILHHHPCSADSHLSGFTFATMSCWVDLVVLPQIHVDSLSFSIVSWYLWHVHHCWPMHSMSHFHCIMIIMAVVLWTRVVYKSYGTVSWCPLHFCHTCSFISIQSLLVLLDWLSGFAIFTCGFIILWHCPMVYVASPPSLSILHHHPCSADSHLSGFTFATMSCWVDLVVLPQIHVDSLSFSTVSWYLWHVHLCWPMHSMSHSHSIMDHYGSRAVDTCGLYILWHCLMVSTAFLSYLLLQSNHS